MGLDVQIHRGSLVENYLNKALGCIASALNKYSRVSMMRFDLHLPENSADSIIGDNFIITKFFAANRTQLLCPAKPDFTWLILCGDQASTATAGFWFSSRCHHFKLITLYRWRARFAVDHAIYGGCRRQLYAFT